MKIGILGSGDVGQALASGLAQAGHSVMISSRDPHGEKIQSYLSTLDSSFKSRISSGSFAEAAKFGEPVVFLAVMWNGVESVVHSTVSELAGKVVLDCTNPLKYDATTQSLDLCIGFTDSAGETVQRWLPESHVVKTLNYVNARWMSNPGSKFGGQEPTSFVAGDRLEDKQIAIKLLNDLGWKDVVDLGALKAARLLEPIAMAWIKMFMTNKSPNSAWKLIRN
eukprot:ANDGO_01570.mRNA.1 F420-dependent NADP reductase